MIKNEKVKRNYLKFLDDWLSERRYTEFKIDMLQKKIINSNDEIEIIRYTGKIKSYTNFLETCDRLYEMMDEQLKEIFKLRYSRGSCLTWEEISDRIHVSQRNIYRKRERILELFAEEIGIV